MNASTQTEVDGQISPRPVLWAALGWFAVIFILARIWSEVPAWFTHIGMASVLIIAAISIHRDIFVPFFPKDEYPLLSTTYQTSVLALSIAVLSGDWMMFGLMCLYAVFGCLAFTLWYVATDDNTKSFLGTVATLALCACINVLTPIIVWVMGSLLAAAVGIAIWAAFAFVRELGHREEEEEDAVVLCTA